MNILYFAVAICLIIGLIVSIFVERIYHVSRFSLYAIVVMSIIFIIVSLIFLILIRKIKYLRLPVQLGLLMALNFTVIGSLFISPVLPILRFPKLWDLPWLGEGVPLCTAGSLERTLTQFWPVLITLAILAVLFLVCILIGRALCAWACPIGLCKI